MQSVNKVCPKCECEFVYTIDDRGYPRYRHLCDDCQQHRGYDKCPDCGNRKRKTSGLCVTCWGKSKRGSNHPHWKGGRHLNKNSGYVIMSWSDDEGRHSSPEHRLIWEREHGPLPDDWVVHHLNGVKHDNRLENLYAMPRIVHDNHRHSVRMREQIRKLQDHIRKLESQLLTSGI